MNDSFDECGALQLLLQQVFVDLADAGGSEVDVEPFLHLSGDLLVLLVDSLAGFNGEQLLIELHGGHDGNAAELLSLRMSLVLIGNGVLSVFLILTLLDSLSAKAVRNVSHDDEEEEEAKGEVSLPFLDDSVKKNDIEPDVGNDGPACGDCKHASIGDFLDSAHESLSLDHRLFTSVVLVVDGINRDARDDQEVERSRTDNRRRAQLARFLTESRDRLNSVEQNFRSTGAERHECKVGDGRVPHGHLNLHKIA